jgi:hypothetical protein
LLKKLKNIEDFQNRGIEQMKIENRTLIEQNLKELTKKSTKIIDKSIDKKTGFISDSIKQIEKYDKQLKESLMQIKSFSHNINYIKEFQYLLILKLINKGIINNKELKEIELRAKNRALKNDES